MSVNGKTKKTSEELVDWILNYKSDLEKAYSDSAWKYFDYEDLHVHLIWNGYKCKKCGSMCAVLNRNRYCIKCLVLREKIGVINKILKMDELMKGGNKKNG